jgi:hypothetical protein
MNDEEKERMAYVAKATGAFRMGQDDPPKEPQTGVRPKPPPPERETRPDNPKPPEAPPAPKSALNGHAGPALAFLEAPVAAPALPPDAAIADAIARLGGKLSLENVRGLITAECRELEALLHEKNAAYGNSALTPKRIFSKVGPLEQIKVRIDDKLSRVASGNGERIDEDTIQDLLGYLILYRVGKRLGL